MGRVFHGKSYLNLDIPLFFSDKLGYQNASFSNPWQITDLQEEAMEKAFKKGLIMEPLRRDLTLFRGFCFIPSFVCKWEVQ